MPILVTVARVRKYVFLGLTALMAYDANADFYTHRWQDHPTRFGVLTFWPEFNFNSSPGNFDANSLPTIPAGFTSYTRINTDLTLAFGLLEPLTIYYRGNWGYNRIQPSALGAAWGFGDQSAGLNFQLASWKSDYAVNIQAQVDFPAYDNNSALANGFPFLGDGSIDASGGLFLTIPILRLSHQKFLLTGGAAYTWRSAGFSAAIPWSLDLALQPVARGFGFVVSGFGNWSLGTDVSGVRPTAGTGGSFLVNAVNPSYFAMRGTLLYRFDPSLAVHVAVSNTVWGNQAPSVLAVTAGLSWDLSASTPRVGQRSGMTGESGIVSRPKDGFVTYDLEARVTRVNDRLNLLRINKGSQAGLQVGDQLDVFSTKSDGTAIESIARAQIISIKSEESALRIQEYFKEVWIEDGFLVKRSMRVAVPKREE